MNYAFEPYNTNGPFGSRVGMTTPNEGVVHLGVIGDTHYIFIEDGAEIPDQPKEINFRKVVLTEEQKEELRTVGFASFKKERLRESIEVDVGDLHDLVADCMKLIEYNTLLSVRLAADYLGVESMSDDVKETYKNRVTGFLGMLENGDLVIRGDFEDVDEMMGRLLARYSKIQEKNQRRLYRTHQICGSMKKGLNNYGHLLGRCVKF